MSVLVLVLCSGTLAEKVRYGSNALSLEPSFLQWAHDAPEQTVNSYKFVMGDGRTEL